jgi:hypothetical protein
MESGSGTKNGAKMGKKAAEWLAELGRWLVSYYGQVHPHPPQERLGLFLKGPSITSDR